MQFADELMRIRSQNLDATHCVLLTGTPLQNNMEELWSLLHFCSPRNFASASLRPFLDRFGTLKDASHVRELQALLRPYLLRRMKDDVETALPPKHETLIEVTLTAVQKKWYRAIYEQNADFLFRGGSKKNGPNLMNITMELRKCCNHPYLNRGVEAQIEREAATASANRVAEMTRLSMRKALIQEKREAAEAAVAAFAKAQAEAGPGGVDEELRAKAAKASALLDADRKEREKRASGEEGKTGVDGSAKGGGKEKEDGSPKVDDGHSTVFMLTPEEDAEIEREAAAAATDAVALAETDTDGMMERLINASGKFVLLDKLLPRLIREKGSKVLIFSQMVMVLDLLGEFLAARGFRSCRLDGRVSRLQRNVAINQFSNPKEDMSVMLLSTRAGGLGLNLTAADTVIIFDSDWNPQNDLQVRILPILLLYLVFSIVLYSVLQRKPAHFWFSRIQPTNDSTNHPAPRQ